MTDPQEQPKRKPSWINHGGNQPVFAQRLERPCGLDELLRIVSEVTARGGRCKPVGSGHSFSDIVQTDDVLIETKHLLGPHEPTAVLPLEDDLWKDPTPEVARVRVACGGTVRNLNTALASAGLAFANLGGYDAQTLIGALSTSTHGSGITLPPLPDAVRSLVLVTTLGKVYQIEPTDGITDPVKFYRRYRAREIELKQDDAWFYSVIVSMGCMGILYSVTVDVVASYQLREHVSFEPWGPVRDRLRDPAFLTQHRHLEVHINPHPTLEGKHWCNVVKRDIETAGEVRPLPVTRRLLTKLAFTPELQRVLVDQFNHDPKSVPGLLDAGLAQLSTGDRPHLEDSYKIYNLGEVNKADVTAIEFSFPLADGIFLGAVDRLLKVVADNRASGLYQNGPLALRFVKHSQAYLSMMYGRDTCTCEVAMFNGTRGGNAMLRSYEEPMYAYQARPHWGQRQELTGKPGWLQSAYPMADRWLAVYRQLNHRGVFNNQFTDRMGISVHPEPGTSSEG